MKTCLSRSSVGFFSRTPPRSHQAGYTLVEMVAVIVLLSFGLIAGTQLFRLTAESYRDTAKRVKQTQDARFVIERISRELRAALPGSVRVTSSGGTQCIEWLPVEAASRYLALPASSSTSFPVMEIDPDLLPTTTYYAVIFPVSTNVYAAAQSNQLALPPLTDIDTNSDRVNLLSAASFPTSSPADRIFFVTSPVAICVQSSGNMLRYANYGFVADATTLSAASGVLLAENLLTNDSGAVTIFDYSSATMTRNSMLQLDLRLRDPNTKEVMRLQHTVFIRNVP